jgi:hypothetical protein
MLEYHYKVLCKEEWKSIILSYNETVYFNTEWCSLCLQFPASEVEAGAGIAQSV